MLSPTAVTAGDLEALMLLWGAPSSPVSHQAPLFVQRELLRAHKQLQPPAAPFLGGSRRNLAWKANIPALGPKSLCPPVSIGKQGQIALPAAPNEGGRKV